MTETVWLGVDLGGTKTALRAQTGRGVVHERVFRWETRGAGADLAQLSAEVGLLRARLAGGFDAVGVGTPATLDPLGAVSAWPNRPEWIGLDLRGAFRELFGGVPVRFADDGDLGALAEADAGGVDRLLYLGVGTGIGGGMAIKGADFGAGGIGPFEIGHVITDPDDGPPCRCGRRGCVQAVASGPATLERAAALRGAPVAFDELRRGMAAGEEWAVAAVELTCRRLAAVITGVSELLAPDAVVIGGGFAAGVPGFVATVESHVHALARRGVSEVPAVRGARFGGLATLHGAVALARLLVPPVPGAS
ncbi:ROK family protein [Actinacidiphila oryziradicis]|uniref:ROK family protein n=1 Tax=Actinacidiphila oryziradicis TaxID=2571141 RepID=A0A4U0S719_9ACTN|nr:ROK family protein [Actinacidiphila oryziradicis]